MVVRVLVVQRFPLVSMENNIVYFFEELVLVLCFAFLLFNFMIFFLGTYCSDHAGLA